MFTKYFRRWCKWWKSWWRWAKNCHPNLFKLWKHYITLMDFANKLYWSQIYNALKEYENNDNFKIFKIKKFMFFNLYLTICFKPLLLMKGFKDLIKLIFYNWVLNMSPCTQNSNINNILLLLIGDNTSSDIGVEKLN